MSGALAFVAYAQAGSRWDVRRRAWWSVVVNAAGCVAFGVSAGAAFVLPSGNDVDPTVANAGTLLGAVCFLLTSPLVLPAWDRASRHAADMHVAEVASSGNDPSSPER